jgi:hypothetical protein
VTATALVDRVTEDGVQARMPWQADDIDGVTWLDRGDVGQLVEVRVADVVDDYDFRATVQRVVMEMQVVKRTRALPLAATSMGSFGR